MRRECVYIEARKAIGPVNRLACGKEVVKHSYHESRLNNPKRTGTYCACTPSEHRGEEVQPQ